jgi:ABC-type multidrug transport system fused ATPase/permease subunit
MNKFYEISGKYYSRFFGAHLLPRWTNWRWVLCIIGFFSNACLTYWFIVEKRLTENSFWAFLIMIVMVFFILLVSCAPILIYRTSETLLTNSAPKNLSKRERIRIEKISYLSELTNKPSSEFLSVAEEINKLLDLDAKYRTAIDPDIFRILRKLCDPQFITGVIAVLLSFSTIFLGFIETSDLKALFGSESGKISLNEFIAILIIFIAAAVMVVLIYNFIRYVVDIFSTFLASFTARKFPNKTVLNHLIRDLISLHTPCQPCRKNKSPPPFNLSKTKFSPDSL